MEIKEKEFGYSRRTLKRQRFDPRLIEHIVRLAEQGIPRRSLVETYGMHPDSLSDWIAKHSLILTKQKIYTVAERRSVVRAVDAGMSIKEAAIAFKVSSCNSIRRWIKDFSQENTEISISNPIDMAKTPPVNSENAEIVALKKALEEANMKNRALNTLIDIAEEQLKIDIRKKPGAKQSSK